MQTLIKAVLMMSLLTFAAPLFAEKDKQLALIKEKLEQNVPNMKVDLVTQSPVQGLYEVLSAGQIIYVSPDAKYLFSGKLFLIDSGITDLTAKSLKRLDMSIAPMRRNTLDAVAKSDMVIFKAADEKYRITVFTDVDCGYCRKLHKEMPEYNKLGITVEYMGFPRAGLGSPSHKKLQTIWCSSDPLEAMNKAKLERKFGNDSCDDPLESHFKLVRQFGLSGTPAVILKSGQLVPGFAEADQMLKLILEDEALLAEYEATAK